MTATAKPAPDAPADAEASTTRPPIDHLAAALAKAQGQIHAAEKSRKNEHFRSKYATLADVWDACRGPLSANGLSVAQLVRAADGGVEVETVLLHASGQSISSVLALPVAQNTAQGLGSAITYGRRYGLAAMVGVAPDEDDDGNAASGTTSQRAEPRGQSARAAAPSQQGKADAEGHDGGQKAAADKLHGLRTSVIERYTALGGKAWRPWLEVCTASGLKSAVRVAESDAGTLRKLHDYLAEQQLARETDQRQPEGDEPPAEREPGQEG
jgi:hypothetical protein